MIKPRIGVSKCLEFDSCRFDGQQLTSKTVAAMKKYVDFIPVCPEVEIGLGTPRPTIRLEGTPEKIELIQPKTGGVLTDSMNRFSQNWVKDNNDFDGFILKSKSPSCGLAGIKIYPRGKQGSSTGKTSGLFAAVVKENFPDLPLEDEGRLTNASIREHFLMNIFTRSRFREVIKENSMKALVEFHSRSKYLFMTLNQAGMRDLGKIVANPEKKAPNEVIENYRSNLSRIFYRIPTRGAAINTLQHTFGHVSDQLTAGEKKLFLDLIESYQKKETELGALIAVMKSHIVRFNETYLAKQTLFDPFPSEFLQLEDTGKGRQL